MIIYKATYYPAKTVSNISDNYVPRFQIFNLILYIWTEQADLLTFILEYVTMFDVFYLLASFRVIKDKVYAAYVKEKEEAKKDYQEAVDRGETAGHVELR